MKEFMSMANAESLLDLDDEVFSLHSQRYCQPGNAFHHVRFHVLID